MKKALDWCIETMEGSSLTMLEAAAQIIYNKKGFNILAIDVQGLSTITDFLLIAETHVDRHSISIARAVMKQLSGKGESPLHVEGLSTGEWIVLDYGQIMIHLFTPGLREIYSLERLWSESKIVELHIDTSVHAS